MLKNSLVLLLVMLATISCKEFDKVDADKIVQKSIEVSGGNKIENSIIDFDFRNRHYKAIRKNGIFQYEREFSDSLGVVKDVLDNKGFNRFLNKKTIKVHDSMAVKYSSSVNSVHYFSLLPYGLNVEAAIKTYMGLSNIKGKDYHKIKVTFKEDGGGEDFEDVFLYWIGVDTYKVDYLAYSYNEDNDIGLRFREAYNERYIDGIRFVDYNNYKPKDNLTKLNDLSTLFEKGNLKLLSKIELKNVSVID